MGTFSLSIWLEYDCGRCDAKMLHLVAQQNRRWLHSGGKSRSPADECRERPAHDAGEPARRLDEAGQGQARRDTAALQHIGDVLGRDIARGARREGTAADTAERGVEHRGALAHCRTDIEERKSTSTTFRH